ncbi:hypothetical protein DFW101_3496 [Solidesulfovibrio carbinoliphilus subsp. oakridgensis]|uniref:Uncharacterized protein n=1 Tax=Solidesulfovibrio carbinoliphilus subsp. oakridgensis TaxID=694327 RepID=G7QC46_9BACT|nr:DUF1799 domain-containing protein [Solidesulfovibrio carbinoliphilus]EHJ49492.1 hypothetical protein DFW101_3496 [Solidesulfovibrio carbinoliphilus subsp. oakridgensis]
MERKKNGPPCGKCRPDIAPGNVEAYGIWSRCRGQLILGFGGAVDINVVAVKTIMDLEEVEDQRECMAKVQTLAAIVLSEQARKREAEKETE